MIVFYRANLTFVSFLIVGIGIQRIYTIILYGYVPIIEGEIDCAAVAKTHWRFYFSTR